MMSKKKRDVSMSQGAPGNNPAPTATTSQPAITIQAQTTSTFLPGIHSLLYSPSYRFLAPSNADYVALRTSTKPYLKGLNERYDFVPGDSSVWYWRRIVFTTKDRTLVPTLIQSSTGAQATAGVNSIRVLRDQSGEATGNYQTLITNLIDRVFVGIYTTDWNDIFTAKIDKTRITPISDRFQRISSQNQTPNPAIRRVYTPINKTLVYDDEENGTSMSVSPLSTEGKPGIGDVYVWDIFQAPIPVAQTSSLTIANTSTLYWHEK